VRPNVLLSTLGARPLITLFWFVLALLLLRVDILLADIPPLATEHRERGNQRRRADRAA
jgi:hypothetical protein